MSPCEPKVVRQCKTCPWRVGCVPERDIPGYDPELHAGLSETIAEPGSISGLGGTLRIMACHYSQPEADIPCAGWLHHQLGEGNHIPLRIAVAQGRMAVPEVEGEQHRSFEATRCQGVDR